MLKYTNVTLRDVMVKCPNCKTDITSKPKKEWNYNIYRVKMFLCPKCKKSVKAYYRNGKLNHTIPKGRKPSS
jgi:uncharacterized protein with PIN domain